LLIEIVRPIAWSPSVLLLLSGKFPPHIVLLIAMILMLINCVNSLTLDEIYFKIVFNSTNHLSTYKMICRVELGPTLNSKVVLEPDISLKRYRRTTEGPT
jgi:hypothetical protein